MLDEAAETPEHEREEGEEPAGPKSAKRWHDALKTYREKLADKWLKQCENLDKLYSKDERSDVADREYSLFWANIEVLKEASYARPPVPVVTPRFKGTNPIARHGSEILERCSVTTFDQSDLHGCMIEVRDEFLRYGRGTARVRLATNHDGTPKIAYDHFNGDDFAHEVRRKWADVNWVGFRAWMCRDEFRERFAQSMAQLGLNADDVPVKKRDPNRAAVDPKEDEIPVWEIWDRKSGEVYFVVEDYDFIVEEGPAWLDLTSFWPCPQPAYGTLVPKTLRPVPEVRQYKDQLEEINTYTARIAALSETLRLKGFYIAGAGEISEAVEAAIKNTDNRSILVPVSSAAALGGQSLSDAIVWLPVDKVAELIKQLVELRRVVIDDVYQITGISDIMRGQTAASETLGAQQLKSQWGSLRVRGRQGELTRFARDMTRITAEIIAENFDPQTMAEMAQAELPTAQQKQQAQVFMQRLQMMQLPPQPGMPPQQMPSPDQVKQIQRMLQMPTFEEVYAFLQDDRARGFIIEVETDSTIQPDEDAEKQRRTEFVTAVGGLLQQALPVVQSVPQAVPFLGEILKFTAQGFRAGRPLEGAIDEFVESMKTTAEQMAQAMAQPKEDPKLEAVKVKSEGDQKVVALKTRAAERAHEMEMQRMDREEQREAQQDMLQDKAMQRDIVQAQVMPARNQRIM